MLDVQINEKVKLLDNINKLFILELPWMQSDPLIQPHFAVFGIETLYRITGRKIQIMQNKCMGILPYVSWNETYFGKIISGRSTG